jgi:hypothetical protein
LRLRFRFDSDLSSPLLSSLPFAFFVLFTGDKLLIHRPHLLPTFINSFRSGSGSSCVGLRRWGNKI